MPRSLSKITLLIPVATLLIVSTGFGALASYSSTPDLAAAAATSDVEVQGAAAQEQGAYSQPDSQPEAEIITVRPTGFEPAAITRPNGEVYLLVRNLTGLDELTLRLDRENGGGRLVEVSTQAEKRDWRKGLDLPPGTYVLTEADHPDWVCRITITSR